METSMDKNFEELSLEANKDEILISQKGYIDRPDATVKLSVDQIDILLKWLKEAKEQIAD